MKSSAPLLPSQEESSSAVPGITKPDSQTQSTVGDAKPSLGRGLASRLQSLKLSTTAAAAEQAKPIVKSPPPHETKAEVLYNPILTHHEKPAIVKKGEAGRKQVISSVS